MKLVYFAWVRERIGRTDEQVTLPEGIDTVADLAPQARIVTPLILEADQERATLNSVATWLGTIEPEL